MDKHLTLNIIFKVTDFALFSKKKLFRRFSKQKILAQIFIKLLVDNISAL